MRCRSRTFTRTGLAAAAVAAVLALSGCSSDSGDDATKQPTPTATTLAPGSGQQPTATASPSGVAVSPSASATSSAPTATGTGDPAQGVDGVWLAMQGATKVQLVLGKGKAALTSTSLCGGGYTDQDGIGLTLTCVDGNKDRTTGRGVLAADGKTLTVQWSGGLTDTFSRTGLPSS